MSDVVKRNACYRLMTGPSHSHRLRNCLRTRQIDDFGFDVVGVGGMPIWSPRLTPYRRVAGQVTHMVGDFRFGNRVLLTSVDSEAISRSDSEFLAIEKSLISPKNDMILYQAAMSCIDRMISNNLDENFLFWDLTIREFEARRSNRYMTDKGYQHPTWNLADIVDRFKGKVISTADILENAAPFYIDSSAHPSFVGWQYIIGKIGGSNHTPSQILHVYYTALQEAFGFINLGSEYKRVVICGNSKFTRILKDYVDRGSFILPDWIMLSVNSMDLADDPDILHIFFPSKFGEETLAGELERIKGTYGYGQVIRANKTPYRIILYDHWASECVARRPDIVQKLDQTRVDYPLSDLEQALCPTKQAYRITQTLEYGGMMELGSSLHPSLLGVLQILTRSILSCSEADSQLYYDLVRSRMTLFTRSA